MIEWFGAIYDKLVNFWNQYEIFRLIVIIIIVSIILSFLLRLIKKYLFKKVKSRKQQSNVIIFIDMMKYLFILFFIIIVFTAYSGTWGNTAFIAGLLTVALGWALQKPISGVVAWLIIVTRRPIHIGDRVMLMKIKGDITNITLTHIFLQEVGGTIGGEELSGRTVMIPNSIIFEQEIINYTELDDFILDEIVTSITYESHLEKAEETIMKSTKEIMKIYWENFPKKVVKDIHTRIQFQPSGIDVIARYMTIAKLRNKIATEIQREIHKRFVLEKDIEFAYPHTEVLFRKK
jgi:small-conductance mechanosensitive channel